VLGVLQLGQETWGFLGIKRCGGCAISSHEIVMRLPGHIHCSGNSMGLILEARSTIFFGSLAYGKAAPRMLMPICVGERVAEVLSNGQDS